MHHVTPLGSAEILLTSRNCATAAMQLTKPDSDCTKLLLAEQNQSDGYRTNTMDNKQ